MGMERKREEERQRRLLSRNKKAVSTKIDNTRRIHFTEEVKVVEIPHHSEYSNRIKDQYWSNADEIYDMACKNVIELDMEGHWSEAFEEDQMIWSEVNQDYIHPAHFVANNNSSSEDTISNNIN